MFGANYYGSVYYGETYSVVYVSNFSTLSSNVTTLAKLSKQVRISRRATVVTIASLLAPYQKALGRLANAFSRALNYPRSTRALNYNRTTRRIF